MSSIFEDEEQYDPDSPEAILRCAVAVACADGEFAHDEQDRVRDVYADICREMTFAYNKPDVSDDYKEIAESTADVVLKMTDDENKRGFIEHCGQFVTEIDLRELTLIMSLRVAGADAHLARAEYKALKTLANLWDIKLHDVLAPYLDH